MFIVKLIQGSGKEGQGMALKAKGLKLTLKLVATHHHHHPPPEVSTHLTNGLMMAR